tara:strand:- start:4827 stop:5372 length:546 start_codon:yes stop_codon:yes gene_type:complete
MTKRAYQKFERNKRDFYRTPLAAVLPLLPHLPKQTRFHEPCAGDGALIRHLEKFGHICTKAGDLVPSDDPNEPDIGIQIQNALTLERCGGEMFITNPPWHRDALHPMIDKFCEVAPVTWLLFDADWMHTKQAIPYLETKCRRVISVGRVSWFGGSVGFDNCCWYEFGHKFNQPIEFFARAA